VQVVGNAIDLHFPKGGLEFMLTITVTVHSRDAMFLQVGKQVSYATAVALTRTAQDAQQALTAELSRTFDRPSPFTLRGVAIKAATKQNLAATVFLRERQADYLAIQITGGSRRPLRRALLLPRNIGLDQYGNIPRGVISRLLARKDVFSGTVRGIPGIWQRVSAKKHKRSRKQSDGSGYMLPTGSGYVLPTGGNTSLPTAGSFNMLVGYEDQAEYRPRLNFDGIVRETVERRFQAQFAVAFAEAIRTAR
jgi:hypothetical protein